jgi:Restriction endonuclease
MPPAMRPTPTSTGRELERRVAAIFRALGANVERDVSLAGSQIDVLAREASAIGKTITTMIECKAYARPVGIESVMALASISYLLKQRSLIDRAIIVSTNRFTRQARDAAREHNIDLVEIADLEHKLSEVRGQSSEAEINFDDVKTNEAKPSKLHAFVLMPFSREFDDVYILGIRIFYESIVELRDKLEKRIRGTILSNKPF